MLPSTFAKATVDRMYQFSIPMRNGEALGVSWSLELVQKV